MRIKTDVEVAINNAQRSLHSAVIYLAEAIDEETWGHSEYDELYLKEAEKVLKKITKLRERLNKIA